MSLVFTVPPNKCQYITSNQVTAASTYPLQFITHNFSVPPYIIWRIGSFVMMWWNESAEIWPSSAYTNNCVRVKDVCSTRPTFISCQLMPFCLPGIELHICVIGFPFHILKQFQLQYAQRLLAHGNRCDGECIAEDRIQFRSTFAILFSGCVRVRACLPACTHFK